MTRTALDADMMNIKTLATRALGPTLTMYRRALRGAHGRPCFTVGDWGTPGSQAIVVGAGPSLDGAREWVAERREAGACVIAVAPAGRAMGWEGVDIGVSVETVEQPGTVPPLGSVRFVVDIGASDAAWDRADAWFTGYYPYHLAMCDALGAKPLHYPGNVGPAALAMALELGFWSVTLVGFDLAYTGGRAYAQGAPWEQTSVTVGEGGAIELDLPDARHAAHDAAGSSRIPARHRGIEAPAWGGVGTVYTTADYHMQAEAMGRLAASYAERRIENATEGGLSIAGIPDVRRADVLGPAHRWRPSVFPDVRDDGGERFRLQLLEEIARVDAIVTDEQHMGGTQGAWRNVMLAGGCPVLSQLIAIGMAQMRMVPGLGLPERLHGTLEVMRSAARMGEELIGEVQRGA